MGKARSFFYGKYGSLFFLFGNFIKCRKFVIKLREFRRNLAFLNVFLIKPKKKILKEFFEGIFSNKLIF